MQTDYFLRLEYRNNGIVECWVKRIKIELKFRQNPFITQYSNVPVFQHSNTFNSQDVYLNGHFF